MRLTQSRSFVLAVCGAAVCSLSLTACGHDSAPSEPLNVSGTSGRAAPPASEKAVERRGLAQSLTTDEQRKEAAASASEKNPTTADSRADAAPNTKLVLTTMRVGQHEGTDRVVFEFAGEGTPGYLISYVDTPTQQGSGTRLEVPGAAHLQVMMTGQTLPSENTAAELSRGLTSAPEVQGVAGVYFAGQFEGMGQAIIGLNARRPYTVFTLSNPTRLVVDLH